MPDHIKESLLSAFGKLKQKVIWKWKGEEMEGKPANVRLMKWCPQQEILAHPNVKLFVTHGGLLSTEESLYQGKPMVYIPGFADQFANANLGEHAGYGTQIQWSDVTGETLL